MCRIFTVASVAKYFVNRLNFVRHKVCYPKTIISLSFKKNDFVRDYDKMKSS